MLLIALNVASGMLALAFLLCVYRLLRGPHVLDRVLALDTLYINALALLVVHGIRVGSAVYFEAALLIALLGFVGTASLAIYIRRGAIVE